MQVLRSVFKITPWLYLAVDSAGNGSWAFCLQMKHNHGSSDLIQHQRAPGQVSTPWTCQLFPGPPFRSTWPGFQPCLSQPRWELCLQELNPPLPACTALPHHRNAPTKLTLAEQASPAWLRPQASHRWAFPGQKAALGKLQLCPSCFASYLLFSYLCLLSGWGQYLEKWDMLSQSTTRKVRNQVGSIVSKRLSHETHCNRLREQTFQYLSWY